MSVGVVLQIMDIWKTRSMQWRMAGMGWSPEMITGMSFIFLEQDEARRKWDGGPQWVKWNERASPLRMARQVAEHGRLGTVSARGMRIAFLVGSICGAMPECERLHRVDHEPEHEDGQKLPVCGGQAFLLAAHEVDVDLPSQRLAEQREGCDGQAVFARVIPESPRYLLQQGRHEEAKATPARFGVTDVVDVAGTPPKGHLRDIFHGEYARRTIPLCVYSALWGFTTFGLIIWLPTELRDAHVASADGVLAQASLLAVPGAIACVFFYNAWSTKGSLVFFGLLTSLTLAGFAVWATVKGQGAGTSPPSPCSCSSPRRRSKRA